MSDTLFTEKSSATVVAEEEASKSATAPQTIQTPMAAPALPTATPAATNSTATTPASSVTGVPVSRMRAPSNYSGAVSKIGRLCSHAAPKSGPPPRDTKNMNREGDDHSINSNYSDQGAVLTHNTEQFIIGQKVWVGGIRPGQIAYIGETHFAPGDWAGVVLDEPNGKNDGCVAGKRYFQCEPKRGIFSRLTRLTLAPLGSAPQTPTSPLSKFSPDRSRTVSPTASVRSSFLRSPGKNGLTVGDRVIVSSGFGSRPGILRYLGETSFASGNWCGIELDEPTGKNDGAVDGIRYFECKPKYGVFVPIAKVSLSPSSKKSRLSRTGSRESLNSIGTMNSIATTNTSRLRMSAQRKSLSVKPFVATPKSPSISKDLLHEKQKHLEQLILERDLDREEAQNQALQYQKAINELKARISHLERALEDERKKSEDLQFSIDEATYCGDGLNVNIQAYKKTIQELEEKLAAAVKEKENDISAATTSLVEAAKEQAQQQTKDFETRFLAMQEEEKRLLENIQYLQVENEALQKELLDKDQSLEKFSLSECGIENLRHELELLKQESEKERQQLEVDCQQKLRAKDESLKSLHEELGIQRNLLATLESDHANLKDECEILQSEFKTRDTELQNVNEQLSKLKAELSMKTAENATLEDLLTAQQAGNVEGKTILEKNIADNDKLKEEITKLQNANQLLERHMQTASEELLKKHETLQDLEDKLTKQLSDKDAALTEATLAIQEHKTHEAAYCMEIEKLQEELKKQAEAYNTTKAAEDELQRNLMEQQQLHAKALEDLNQVQTLCADLSQKLEKTEESLSAKTREVEILNVDLSKLVQNAESLEKHANSSVQQMNVRQLELEEQIKQLQTKIQQQENSLTQRAKEHDDQVQLLKEKNEALLSTQAALEAATDLANKLKQEQMVSAAKCNELEQQLKKSETQCAQQQLEVGDLSRKLEALNSKCDNLSTQNESLAQELKATRNSGTDLQTELRKINEELVAKQKSYLELQTSSNDERMKLESQIEELNQKLVNMSKDIAELQTHVKQAKLELVSKNEQISALQENIIKQELALSDAQCQHENLQAKHDALVVQNKSLQDDLTTLRTSSTDSNAELLKMTRDASAKQQAYEELLDKTNGERVALNNQVQAGQQRIDTLCGQIETLTLELKNATEESVKRLDALKKEQDKCGKQELELSDLSRKLDALNTKSTSLEADNESMQKDLSTLRAASTDTSTVVTKLQEELAGKQKELQEHMDKTSAERLQLDKKLHELNQQLQSNQQELEKLRAELQNANEAKSLQANNFEVVQRELQAQQEEIKAKAANEQKALNEQYKQQLQTAEQTKLTLDEAISSLQQQIKLLQDELLKSQLDFKSKEVDLGKQIDNFVIEREHLLQTLQQLQTEGSNTLNNAQQQKLELEQRLAQLQEQLKAEEAESQIRKAEAIQLQTAQSNTNDDINKLREQLKSLENALELANTEVAHRAKVAEDDKRKMNELREMIEAAQAINANISSTNEKLSEALQILEQEKCETANIFELFEMESDKNLEKLTLKLSELKQQGTDAQMQLQEKQATLTERESALESANAKLEASQNALACVQLTLLEHSTQINELNQANAELRRACDELELLRQKNTDLESQLEEYKKVVDEMDDTTTAKTTKMLELQTYVEQLESERQDVNDAVDNLQRHLEATQLEKAREVAELKERIKDLQVLQQVKQNGNATSGNDAGEVNTEENTAQINFLNSIIADMQKKNDSLKSKIEALESMPIDYTQSKAFDLLTKRKPAPRVFCDICDEFDKHETEDCPLQASDDREYTPPPTDPAQKKERKLPSPRKYCESCEVFGHETGECDNDECY